MWLEEVKIPSITHVRVHHISKLITLSQLKAARKVKWVVMAVFDQTFHPIKFHVDIKLFE